MSAGKLSEQALTEKARGNLHHRRDAVRRRWRARSASADPLTDFYLGCGVNGITILGIMGEAPKLTPAEQVASCKRVFAPRRQDRQVIVGVSHRRARKPAAFAARGRWIAGAAGVMVAPLAGPEERRAGVYNYFAQVFAGLGPDIPVVFQDYPQATGVHLAPPVFERLVDDLRSS